MKTSQQQKRDFSGSNNPHYAKPHTLETRQKISQTQRLRWQYLRQLADKQNRLTEQHLHKLIKEEIAKVICLDHCR